MQSTLDFPTATDRCDFTADLFTGRVGERPVSAGTSAFDLDRTLARDKAERERRVALIREIVAACEADDRLASYGVVNVAADDWSRAADDVQIILLYCEERRHSRYDSRRLHYEVTPAKLRTAAKRVRQIVRDHGGQPYEFDGARRG